jgi:Rod binding domain-containing protein
MDPVRALAGGVPRGRLTQDPLVVRGAAPRFLPIGGGHGDERAKAEQTAGQFEQLFVRSMVSSLRASATLGEGGMFGSGPGSDTFGDWFDQNLAEQISTTAHVGIKEQLLADLERHHEIPRDLAAKAHAARAAADRTSLFTQRPLGAGGIDVVSR